MMHGTMKIKLPKLVALVQSVNPGGSGYGGYHPLKCDTMWDVV